MAFVTLERHENVRELPNGANRRSGRSAGFIRDRQPRSDVLAAEKAEADQEAFEAEAARALTRANGHLLNAGGLTHALALAVLVLLPLAAVGGQPDSKTIEARKAARKTASEALDATVSGIWAVRDAAVQVVAVTPADGPCRAEWLQLAARSTQALWPYVADWTTATAETTAMAVAEAVAAAVADKTAAEAVSYQEFLDEMEALRPGYGDGGHSMERQLAAVEDKETTDVAFNLAQALSASVRDSLSEAIGCAQRGGLTWEEWVEAEAAGELPAKPPLEQREAAEKVQQQTRVFA